MLTSIGACLVVGLLAAYSVASEPIAYVASMTYGILVLFVLPVVIVVLFISAIVAAILDKARYAAALVLCCILLPVSFLGGLQAMKVLRLARYETPGLNDMRPIDEQPNGNVIVIYTKESTFDEQEKLSNEVIHPWKEGPGFTGETGVQASIGLGDIDGRIAQKILFRASATEVEKEKLRMGLQASPVVYKYFENLTEAEVREKLTPANGKKPL
ncbi:MAG: hypothetical protein ABIR33_04985 [Pyrinomonadaceae bacterium]